MPKYYCDYCDTYLTHDSPSVRKTHCNGRKHKENVRLYYQKWLEEQVQKLVDDTTAAYKAGKIANNPFGNTGGGGTSGAMIPPPTGLGGKTVGGTPAPGAPVTAQIPGVPPGMPLMGPPPGGPMPPMMPVGMRPPMGPPMGPHMHPMMSVGMRPPLVAGPPPAKMQRK